ncbi:MAG: hypothetical protein J0H62_10240 [Rhizobiales bacterium]|nr:hypothetical protein [Hyphomicrobiales bacterium]
MPYALQVVDQYLLAFVNRVGSVLSLARGAFGDISSLKFGWLAILLAMVLVFRFLLSRPALFALVILISIEAGSAATVSRAYTAEVERLFARLTFPRL